jgi:hypothetical protein
LDRLTGCLKIGSARHPGCGRQQTEWQAKQKKQGFWHGRNSSSIYAAFAGKVAFESKKACRRNPWRDFRDPGESALKTCPKWRFLGLKFPAGWRCQWPCKGGMIKGLRLRAFTAPKMKN